MTVTKGGVKSDGSRTRYFSCTGKSHNRICEGVKTPLYADCLEDMVYRLISEKMLLLKNGKRKITTDNSNKINLLKNHLSSIKAEQEKLVNIMLKDGIETEMLELLNTKAKNLSDEKKSIIEKIEILENESEEVVNVINLAKKWKAANYDEKKAVCNLLIDKIYIDINGAVEIIWNI